MTNQIGEAVHDFEQANSTAKLVQFYCHAPDAGSVCLLGEFNDWNPESHPMIQRTDGFWYLELPLAIGDHLYRFMVDGKPTLYVRAI